MAQLERVVEQDPQHEDALLALANGAIQQRDGLRAMGYFERVVEINPANVEGLRGLARSLVSSRRIGEGIHARLHDLEPARHTDFLPHLARDLVQAGRLPVASQWLACSYRVV